MDESGINLNFDLDEFDEHRLLEIVKSDLVDEVLSQITNSDIQNFDFYELRSKTVPLSVSLSESPTIKTEMVKSRTQFKQQLMRDQELQKEQEKRRKAEEAAKANKRSAEPVQIPLNIHNVELPQHVLQVTSVLKNPTKYHILAKQKNQVLQYLSSSQPEDCFLKKPDAHSAPVQQKQNQQQPVEIQSKYPAPATVPSPVPAPVPAPAPASVTTDPSPEILSPGINSVTTSCGTSDAEDVLEGILSYEANSFLSDFGNDSAVQSQSLFGSVSKTEIPKNKNSNSCPSGLQHFKQELSSFGELDPKDRIKKDNHNIIERRRRCNINDRIKELGELLPKTNDPHYDLVRDNRQNKGTILKSSVDYIKVLKHDIQKLKQIELDNKQLQAQNRKLLLRIQELERQAKENGLPVKDSTWKVVSPETLFNSILKNDWDPKSQSVSEIKCETDYPQCDLMEQDIAEKDVMC